MPAIRQAMDTNPTTGEAGVWVEDERGIIGLAKSAWPSNPGGPAATRLQRWQDAINAALASVGEIRIPLSSIPADDARRTTPEPFCRISGTDYICNPFIVTVTLTNLSPLIYDWKVTAGTTAPVRL